MHISLPTLYQSDQLYIVQGGLLGRCQFSVHSSVPIRVLRGYSHSELSAMPISLPDLHEHFNSLFIMPSLSIFSRLLLPRLLSQSVLSTRLQLDLPTLSAALPYLFIKFCVSNLLIRLSTQWQLYFKLPSRLLRGYRQQDLQPMFGQLQILLDSRRVHQLQNWYMFPVRGLRLIMPL